MPGCEDRLVVDVELVRQAGKHLVEQREVGVVGGVVEGVPLKRLAAIGLGGDHDVASVRQVADVHPVQDFGGVSAQPMPGEDHGCALGVGR